MELPVKIKLKAGKEKINFKKPLYLTYLAPDPRLMALH